MWTILKVFIEFVTIMFLSYGFIFLFVCLVGWFFSQEVCGSLAPQLGIKPTSPALEGKVLTPGPPGKTLEWILKDAEELAKGGRCEKHPLSDLF